MSFLYYKDWDWYLMPRQQANGPTCRLCRGSGKVRRMVDWDLPDYEDWYMEKVPCPGCQEQGKADEDTPIPVLLAEDGDKACDSCGGELQETRFVVLSCSSHMLQQASHFCSKCELCFCRECYDLL